MAKINKSTKQSKSSKADIPVLNTPAESRGGRIVIWVILIAMVLGAVGSLIAAIILNS